MVTFLTLEVSKVSRKKLITKIKRQFYRRSRVTNSCLYLRSLNERWFWSWTQLGSDHWRSSKRRMRLQTCRAAFVLEIWKVWGGKHESTSINTTCSLFPVITQIHPMFSKWKNTSAWLLKERCFEVKIFSIFCKEIHSLWRKAKPSLCQCQLFCLFLQIFFTYFFQKIFRSQGTGSGRTR